MKRLNNRQANQSRPISVVREYTKHAPGSVLISFGDTKVICTATVEESVPRFLRDTESGWLTAEYSMLPSATHDRYRREVNKGKTSGRTSEIQRLIGRSLRAAIDFKKLGERTIYIDADVIQADGGTRTAAITGGMIALEDCINTLLREGKIKENPIKNRIAAVSVGKYQDHLILDLCYEEDSKADLDMNIVMTDNGQFIEVQGTAEQAPFSQEELNGLISLATEGIDAIFSMTREISQA